ncbi:MAG: DUF2292 domain-containing protein [Acidobacteria bacterium]|nr:MAG: DUF2292 domain-containing protein [Acidobacteriota bacterium]
MSEQSFAPNQISLNRDERTMQQLISEILSALNKLRYGSVEITVHNSKIVQIEKKEKLRFDKERSIANPSNHQ